MNKPASYHIVSQEFSPMKVRIRGSSDRVQAVHLIKTDPIDLSGVAGEQVFHTHLNIGDAQLRLVDTPSDVTVRVKLEKTLNGGAR